MRGRRHGGPGGTQGLSADSRSRSESRRLIRFDGGGEAINPPWADAGEEKFFVPFVFSTNGRPYLKQLETESGIWFPDLRKAFNHRRALSDWPTPDGLKGILEIDAEVAHVDLKARPFDFGFPLRAYLGTVLTLTHALIVVSCASAHLGVARAVRDCPDRNSPVLRTIAIGCDVLALPASLMRFLKDDSVPEVGPPGLMVSPLWGFRVGFRLPAPRQKDHRQLNLQPGDCGDRDGKSNPHVLRRWASAQLLLVWRGVGRPLFVTIQCPNSQSGRVLTLEFNWQYPVLCAELASVETEQT